MTPDYVHEQELHGRAYRGELYLGNTEALEEVQENGITVWECTFPLSNLGGAGRQEYLKVMTESIADRRKRDKYSIERYYA
jgi:hypothetical protein